MWGNKKIVLQNTLPGTQLLLVYRVFYNDSLGAIQKNCKKDDILKKEGRGWVKLVISGSLKILTNFKDRRRVKSSTKDF